MEDGDLKPMQPWGSIKRTLLVGERDPMTGRVPVHLPNNGSHPGSSFLRNLLEDWRRERK